MGRVLALALLVLQGCGQQPPRTVVVPPRTVLPDATVLRPEAVPATQSPEPAATQEAASPPSKRESRAGAALPGLRRMGDPDGARLLAERPLVVPVLGVQPGELADHFEQARGHRVHEAIDILAPAGTPVVAADDGRIAKLFTSRGGGLTIYHFDPESSLCYYYAHLQRYADGLREGQEVRRGQVIGYVGSTGNADARAPHLHFAVFRLEATPRWWKGLPVNPYPALSRAEPAGQVAGVR